MAINQLIEGRITAFLYSKKQKEIVGKDGEQELNKVFGQEARFAVVLYDSDWGKTPWTRIEETAIRNRAYSEGYDFVLFILTKANLTPPVWLPKNRLWFGLDRYGIKGAAAVIESRVQELNGKIRELTAMDISKLKAKEIEFEDVRRKFLHSYDGINTANQEVERLFSGIKSIVSQIQSESLKFRIQEDKNELVIYSSGYTLFILWSLQYINSLDHSALRVQFFRGSIPFKNSIPIESPKRLQLESYYFDKLISEQYCWRLGREDGEPFSTEQLIESCMTEFMDLIKDERLRR